MHAQIKNIIDGVIQSEGGYVNHPSDRGGPTKYGITLATLAAWRGKKVTAEDVKQLTREEAFNIYYKRYVTGPGFDKIVAIDVRVGAELVDSGVLSGPAVPSRWLQRSLNVFNKRGSLYPDILVDGALGPKSIDAFKRYMAVRGPQASVVMHRTLNCLQGEFMVTISENRSANEDFTYGWLLNRVG